MDWSLSTYLKRCEVRAAAHSLSLRDHHLRVLICVYVCVWRLRACGQVEFTAGGAPREWGSAGATPESGCAAARSIPWGRRVSDVCGWLRLRGGAFDTVSPYSVAELRAIAKVSSRHARARASLCCARKRALCCQRWRVFGLVVCARCPASVGRGRDCSRNARASLCFAAAQTAHEDADFINSPPVFGAPAADSDLDSSDMSRPRLAGGIRPTDLTDLPCQHTHSNAPSSSEYVSLGDDCKWCDEQWQKDVKLLTAGREGSLEGVLRAIEEGLGSRVYRV